MKKIASGIMVILFLIGLLSLVFDGQPFKANARNTPEYFASVTPPVPNVLNVNTSLSYSTIQAAINDPNTLPGHFLFLSPAVFHEHVVINKSLRLYGSIWIEHPEFTTTINGNGTGNVVTVESDNVMLRWVSVINGTNGVYLRAISNCTLGSEVLPSGLDFAIANNTGSGIYLESSLNNSISGYYIANNTYGIMLDSSLLNSISGNCITDNYHGIMLNSSILGRISENYITNNYQGIRSVNSNFSSILENQITNNGYGTVFASSSVNILSENNVTYSKWENILFYNSGGNLISGNNITDSDIGVDFSHCEGNIISGNNIARSDLVGVWFSESSNNIMCGNDITENNLGIELIYSSSSSIIYHNNFANNTRDTYIQGAGNVWDNGVEGNYWSNWSNYTGVDADHDGIGDTPYILNINNQDNYPLMSPYIAGDYNHDGAVNMTDVDMVRSAWQSRIGDLNYNPHVDFDMDGIINIKDASIIGVNWQRHI